MTDSKPRFRFQDPRRPLAPDLPSPIPRVGSRGRPQYLRRPFHPLRSPRDPGRQSHGPPGFGGASAEGRAALV